MLTEKLYDHVFDKKVLEASDTLYCVSGFASAAFAKHIISQAPELSLRLLVGMASRSGIPEPDHRGFQELVANSQGRFVCSYFIDRTPCHSKCYGYFRKSVGKKGFVGSANFTWGGFRDNREAVVECDPKIVRRYYELLIDRKLSIDCNSKMATELVTVVSHERNTIIRTRAEHGVFEPIDIASSVEVSLLPSRGEIHIHSGLNWGQRDRRNPNQAYIPVSSSIHKKDPTFFPPLANWFLVQTDDGELLWCVMAQANRKGIQTPENNAILGEYFRKRLNVKSGAPVTLSDLKRYGRTSVTFYRIDGDLYLMDFSKPK